MIVVVEEVIEAVVATVAAVMVVEVTVAVVMVVVAVMVVATDHLCKCTRQLVRSAENLAKCLSDPAIPSRFFVLAASRAKMMIPGAADQVETEILTDVILRAAGEEVMATTKCMMRFVAIVAEIAKYRSNLPVTSRFIAINVLEGIRI